MKFIPLPIILLASLNVSDAFTPSWAISSQNSKRAPSPRLCSAKTDEDLGLTPELERMAAAFENIGDDKLRYKQLLYMANQLEAAPKEIMLPENKVPGCLSTVYIDGTATYDDEKQAHVIKYVGDSDGLLTKGLVALLIRGLSGCTAEEIQKVDPTFIEKAKISQSLTPGRNNGFLNMLNVMKKKALALEQNVLEGSAVSAASSNSDDSASNATEDDSDHPMYNAIIKALQQLKPTKLELIDNSHQHAGHAGSKGFNGESHFKLSIVAEAFEGLNLVKRHQLVYMLLGDVMPKIHALQIQANTPDEVA